MLASRIIDRPLEWLLRGGLFVAGCAVALAWETTLLSHEPARPTAFYAFVFFATWASYRLHAVVAEWRQTQLDASPEGPAHEAWAGRPRHERIVRFVAGHQTSLASTAAAFLGTVLLLPTAIRADDLPTIAIAGLCASLYCIPATRGIRPLREFGVVKITVLAGVWTLVTAYLPATGASVSMLAYLCARRFAFMFALCVAFDVRDASLDARGGIRTVAVLLGTRHSYTLMRITLLAFAGLVLVGPLLVSEPLAGRTSVALLISAAITWLAIELTRHPAVGRRFYLGCIDGMMLVQCLLVAGVMRVR